MNYKLKLSATRFAIVGLVLFTAVGIWGSVKANEKSASTVIEHADNVTVEAPKEVPTETSEVLGTLTSPDIENPYLSVNGDIEYHVLQTFKDATTTIIAIPNPFRKATSTANDVVLEMLTAGYGVTGATSTVSLARLEQTGAATSTFSVACAAAPNQYSTSSISYNILDSGLIATSTNANGIIENNLTSTYNQGIGGGSVAKIMLTPSLPWLICKVYVPYGGGATELGAFTNPVNTFEGRGFFRISRWR